MLSTDMLTLSHLPICMDVDKCMHHSHQDEVPIGKEDEVTWQRAQENNPAETGWT